MILLYIPISLAVIGWLWVRGQRYAMRAVAAEERARSLEAAQAKAEETFRSLSFEALQKNNEIFLSLAKTSMAHFQENAKSELEKKKESISDMVAPMKELLAKVENKMGEMEKERKGELSTWKEQMRSLLESEKQLRFETANLVKALRAPATRGRWGEIQLKRVVELAGMLPHCDFYEQRQDTSDEGRLRPDLLIRLPGGRQVVIDAKTPLEAYLDAIETQDENVRIAKFGEHARQVRQHIQLLSRKAYWERFQPTPEFVVLFLPSEAFFSAALEQDPMLIETGAEHRVVLATPSTLIALLRAVAYGWKQESLSRHAEMVSQLGQELHKRTCDMVSHWSKMGRSLAGAVDSYNKAVGSLESRVLPAARKFKDLNVASPHIEIESLEAIEKIPRELQVETQAPVEE